MVLQSEIRKISNPQLREAVKKCIEDRAKKLKLVPASTSGKYHPPDERGTGGLIRHIKKLVWLLEGLTKHFGVSDGDHDCLIASAFFHDIALVELVDFDSDGSIILDRKKYHEHPKISSLIAVEYLTAEGINWDSPLLIKIVDIISSHMGKWYPNCKSPFSSLEIMFSTADYFASRENVTIKL
jgi:hypothetical protein